MEQICDDSDEILKIIVVKNDENPSNIVEISNSERKKSNKLPKLKRLTCKSCNIVFDTVEEFKQHKYQEKLTRTKKEICTICNKTFLSNRIKDHMLTHTREKPFTCEICFKKVSRKATLQKHMLLHTGKSHFCTVCEKGFTNAYALNDHLNTHSGENKHICSTCGKIFLSIKRFSAHKAYHRDKSTGTVKKYSAKQKRDDEKPVYACYRCKKIFQHKQTYDIHMANHENSTFLICDICGKRFSLEIALVKHTAIHNTRYRCLTCRKIYVKSDLKSHDCQPDSNDETVKLLANECEVCGRITKSESLALHMKKHEEKSCNVCGEKFNDSVVLRSHRNLHKFQCEICHKRFTNKSGMQKHIENETCLLGRSKNRNTMC